MRSTERGALARVNSSRLFELACKQDALIELIPMVGDFVPYDAERPRSDATLSEHDFVRVKAHCLDVFQREVRKA